MKTIAYKIKTHLVEYLGVPIGPVIPPQNRSIEK
jgi:hypothetical protein